MAEWYLFLPQVRVPVADIVERARQAEASGFSGIAFIDHLEAPGLHRYFAPFLVDKNLIASDGVIDFVIDYTTEAMTPSQ